MSKAADVQRLFQQTKKIFGSLDVLVNNAGVFEFESIEAVTEAEFHREFNVNVLAPIGPEGGISNTPLGQFGQPENIAQVGGVPGL